MCGVENLYPVQDRKSPSGYGKAPTRQLHSNPIAVSGSGHTGTQIKSFEAVIHMKIKSASQAALSRMQLTLHATRRTPHGASRLVLAISAWSVKTRHAPSRHCRDARVYGHTTTDMHDNEHTSPATSSPSVFKTDRGGVRKRTILPSQLELYLVLHRCHHKK